MNLNDKGILSIDDISEVGITEGLVAWYPFDGNANDYSGNKLHGDLMNSPISVSGMNNLCYQFDGSTNYINIIGNPILEPQNITVSAWINMDSDASTGRHIFLTKWYGYSCEIEATSRRPYFRLATVGDVSSSENLILGKWYHFVGTFENGVGSKIYLNGVKTGEKASASPISYTSNAVLNIGRYAGGVYFKGRVDDVRIYNRALSSDEIGILYDLGIGNSKMKITDDTLYLTGQIKEV